VKITPNFYKLIDQQKEFLRLYVINQLKIKEVSEIMDLPKTKLSQWYEELKPERIP